MIPGWNFWIFFSFVLLGFSLLYQKRNIRNRFLLLCGLGLYGYLGGWLALCVLLFSILLNFGCGWLVHPKNTGQKTSIFWLVIGILLNLSLLFYFRYAHLLIQLYETAFHTQWDPPLLLFNQASNHIGNIPLLLPPLGLLIFSLQALSYLIDVHSQKTPVCRKLFDFGLYLSFFPQWIAGPLVKAENFLPQLQKHYQLSSREFAAALFLVLCGLFKLSLLMNYLGTWIEPVLFSSTPLTPVSLYNSFDHWMAVYGNALQIYAAFSGYADLSIGLAAMLGFQLPFNFQSPYQSASLSEFWRRWNKSLFEFLKSYLYIPLGGNQHGPFLTLVAAGFTFLFGALFYGVHLSLFIWAGLQWILYSFEKIFSLNQRPKRAWIRFIRILICFHLVCLGWLLFRSPSLSLFWQEIQLLRQDVSWSQIMDSCLKYSNFFILIMLGFLLHFIPDRSQENIKNTFTRTPWFLRGFITLTVIGLIYLTLHF